MSITIKTHIQSTLQSITDVPSEYKTVAFQTVLNYLLSSDQSHVLTDRKKSPLTVKGHSDITSLLKGNFDWASTKILSLKPTPQILLILKIAQEHFSINELSPTEIQKILFAKFRITKSTNAISMLLMEKLGKYVDRIQEGNRYFYRLTENGQLLVDDELKV